MPRAYSPNLRTVQRANAVATALGIKGWHLAKGPDLFWHGEGFHFELSGSRLNEELVMNGCVRYLGSSTTVVTVNHCRSPGPECRL